MGQRTLIYDIERRPHLVYQWDLKGPDYTSPTMLYQEGGMISWAARWYDETKIRFASTYHDGHTEMCDQLHRLLDEADVVVGYNQVGFDDKHVRTELVRAGYQPPSPWHSIDLLKVVRSRFKFPSNRLNEVCAALGIGTKVDTGGFDLWRACIEPDHPNHHKAWKLMRRYNKADVQLTTKLYEYLDPWIPGTPVDGTFDGHCPKTTCRSNRLVRRGYGTTKAGISYVRYQCKDCGGYCQETRAVTASAGIKSV